MTTPYQSSPDGAIVVGGGEWKYTQTINEATHRSGYEMPQPTPDNMVELLQMALERLPIDALKPFAGFLGIVDGVFTSVSQAVEAIIGSLVERVVQTVQDFNAWVTDFFGAMGSGLLTGDLTDFGDWWDSNITQPVVGTVDGFVRGVLGMVGSGFNVNIVEETAQKLADSIADMNEAVNRLDQKSGSGKFTGTATSINFASISSTGSYFSQTLSGTGAGSLTIAGSKLGWSGTATNRSSFLKYTVADTKSDYQKIGSAYATLPSTNFLGGWKSYNYLYGRINAAGTSYVYAQLGASDLEIGCYVAGAKTVFATLPGFKFKPGAAYWLECGTTGGARIFRVWENRLVILTYTDASSVSSLGSGFRSVGLGATAFSDTYLPAKAASFAFFDNVPVTITGCGWRVTRTSGTLDDISTGTNLFPTSWFNTIDYMSDDLTAAYVASTNKIVVPADGWYAVSVYQYGNNSVAFGAGGRNRAALFKNGTAIQYSNPTPANSVIGYSGFGGTFTTYCVAGDELQPGYNSDWAAANLLESDGGLGTYWAGTFLGNQKAVN